MKDVRGKLKPADFQVATETSDEVVIKVCEEEKTFNIDNLKQVNFLGEVNEDVLINDLLISKEDYAYWWSSTRRINKLFKKEEASPKDEGPALLSVGCANITENGLEMLKVCEGNKKEIIAFINEQLSSRHLKSFGYDITVFKFDYVDEDKEHPERWFTIEELAEKGDVVLS